LFSSGTSAILAKVPGLPARADEQMKELLLCQAAGLSYYNTSRLVFQATDAAPKAAPYVSLFAGPRRLFPLTARRGGGTMTDGRGGQ